MSDLTEIEREALMLAMCAPDPDRAPVTEIQLLHLDAAVAQIIAARQTTTSDHLDRAKDEAGRHHDPHGASTASSPDERTVPSLLSGILDALIAIGDALETTLDARRGPEAETKREEG